jgi:radical SAM-linked protein
MLPEKIKNPIYDNTPVQKETDKPVGTQSTDDKPDIKTDNLMPIPVRLQFQKTGSLQFISHLDLCRTMKTAFVRSKIPIWYSEGFNPQPKMVFSLPLSIGCQSVCELLDIRITSYMPFEDIVNRLNNTLTDELKIIKAYTPEHKFAKIGWAGYSIYFDETPAENFTETYKGSFIITKRTKRGEREIDAAPLIRNVLYDPAEKRLDALLSAESENYLNPEYIVKAAECPDYSIIRTAIYFSDGVTPFV